MCLESLFAFSKSIFIISTWLLFPLCVKVCSRVSISSLVLVAVGVGPVLLVLRHWRLSTHLNLHGSGKEQLLWCFILNRVVHSDASARVAAGLLIAVSCWHHHCWAATCLYLIGILQLFHIQTLATRLILAYSSHRWISLDCWSSVAFLGV